MSLKVLSNKEKDVFTCPVCHEALEKGEKAYACKNSHSFDIASQGYVNLMPTDKPHANSGDNGDMMAARTSFLETGAYTCLLDALKKAVFEAVKTSKTKPLVVDAGCGEGYYTCGISQYLKEMGVKANVAGIDIAKKGIKYAARRDKEVSFAVAGIFNLPFADESADAVVNIFAPVCEKEFARVLKPGGLLFIAGPGKNHLFGLKSAVYDTPYLNDENVYKFAELENLPDIRVHDDITVKGENIHNLFTMTPYFFNTPREEAERLDKLETLDTSIDFVISVLKKK